MRSLRTALAGLGLLGIVAGVVTIGIVSASDQPDAPEGATLIIGSVIGWAFIGTGLFAWLRRPDNRSGALMTAVGFVWFLAALSASDTPWVFIVGILFGALTYALLLHMLVAFPSGRLEGKWATRFVAIAYLDTTVIPWIGVLFHQTADHSGYCDGCPANPIVISDQLGFAEFIFGLQSVIGVVGITGVAIILIRRWRGASASYRRAIAPVLLSGIATIVLLGISLLGDVTGAPDGDAEDAVDLAALIAFASVPFAFLFGLLRSRLSRASAVSELVTRLSESDPRQGMRDALAEALGDPSLSLAYWVPEQEGYVDAAGRPVQIPAREGICTHVEHEGRPVAVICHDSSLENERELVQAVGAAASIALENERLNAELRARVEELRASRARIVQAGDEERRRIERDLHDGAQQRLVALALNMRLIGSKLDSDPAGAKALVEETSRELAEATNELRELARGLHPAVLSDRGLRPALEALAGRAPLEVELVGPPGERLPAPIERASYYVVAEALTNVARYADASHASVNVSRANGSVTVEVRDDGVGGADPQNGSGLRGLADRVAALDGRLEVTSPAGSGTVVTAVIPCA